MNPKIRPNYLHRKIKEVLERNFGPIRVVEDPIPDGYKKGTKKPIKWARRQYYMENFPFPFETMVFRTGEFLDYRYDLGTSLNPEEINAREIYEIYRVGVGVGIGYPREDGLYENYDLEGEIADQIEIARGRILQVGLPKRPFQINLSELAIHPSASIEQLIGLKLY